MDPTAQRREPSLRMLIPLAAFTALALGGYGAFALAPERIPSHPYAVRFYQSSFQWLAQIHIVVALGTLVTALLRTSRQRWIPALFAVGALAFLSEWVGTGYGIPFGSYRYTGLLGYRLGGRVPWSIPLSWFLMAVPSYLLARRALPTRATLPVLVAGAALLTIWDLSLDPAMSRLTPYWVWSDPGPYYGMPLVNLAGWMCTSLVLMGVLAAAGADRWGRAFDARWLAGFYGLVLAMPMGMLVLAGLWGAALTTGLALLAWTGISVLAPAAGLATRTQGAQ